MLGIEEKSIFKNYENLNGLNLLLFANQWNTFTILRGFIF